jgi:aldose 1-epimerase
MMPVADHTYASTTNGVQTVALVSPDESLRAAFAPSAGMVCCSLRHDGAELLAQRDGVSAYAERGSTMGIPLLHPWANRLAGFTYGAPRDVVELAVDCPLLALEDNGLPIHGVIARYVPWEVREANARRLRARMRWERPELRDVFPFPHTLDFEARMGEATLTIETTMRPCADLAVPVSFGYHPYLTIPETNRGSWQVELPIARRLSLDARMIPTGGSEPINSPRFKLRDSGWDDAFGGLAPASRFAVSAGGRRIEVEFIEGYPYAQVFSPSGENFICFEPMTAPTNALVSGVALPLVAPGEEFRATFRISVADEQ